MRTVAQANYYALRDISTNPVATTVANPAGGIDYIYTFATSPDTNIAGYKVTIATGAQQQLTKARSDAWSKTRTAFMGFTGIPSLMKLNTRASTEAQRRPRLMVMVLDRSGSMSSNGGHTNLAKAVTNFLGLMKNDPTANTVGIVSFSSFARVEMEPTTNFWQIGTNIMTNVTSSSKTLDGMKFGGCTSADEGMRLGLEIMKQQSGYDDPRTVKYIIFFTDGEFNSSRSMYTAPAVTNILVMPTNLSLTKLVSNKTNILPYYPPASSYTYVTASSTNPGTSAVFSNTVTKFGSGSSATYASRLNISMVPGSVNYLYRTNGSGGYTVETNWSRATGSIWLKNIILNPGDSNVFITPAYVVDAIGYYNMTGKSASNILTNLAYSGLTLFKPEDLGENVGNYYPGGQGYWTNNTGSGGETNFGASDSYMAGELFYNVLTNMSPTRTQAMTNITEWQRNIPWWITNNFESVNSPDIMTNYTSTNPDARYTRYYARVFKGDPKPNDWYIEGGSDRTTNRTMGGAIQLNGAQTNINAMSFTYGPTHYYDFEQGTWRALTNWMGGSTGNNPQILAMCNWKAKSYSDQARRDGVIVYTVGFAKAPSNVLMVMANDPISGTNFISTQPQGKYYYCGTNPAVIGVYFQKIAEQILAFISE